MLCYKDGRTAHLIARGDCNLPNNAVIWGTKGFIEVSALVCLILAVRSSRHSVESECCLITRGVLGRQFHMAPDIKAPGSYYPVGSG